MTRTFDPIDDALDLRDQWNRVLDVVCSTSTFTDNERIVWVYFMLGVPTEDIARLVTKPDGTPITRQRVDQLVRKSLTKLFTVLNAGPAPKPSTISRAAVRNRQESDHAETPQA